MTEAPESDTGILEAILAESARRSITLTELAQQLGMSMSYLYALRSGHRKLRNLDRDKLLAIAAFLGRTPASVYVAAGILKPTDFFVESPESLRDTIHDAFDFVARDPEWCELCPAPKNLDTYAKLFVVLAWQRASNRQILPRQVTRDDLIVATIPNKQGG